MNAYKLKSSGLALRKGDDVGGRSSVFFKPRSRASSEPCSIATADIRLFANPQREAPSEL